MTVADRCSHALGDGRGSGRPADEPAQPGRVHGVSGTVSSDDGAFAVTFDALEGLRSLTDEQVARLVAIERGGHADDSNDIAVDVALHEPVDPAVEQVCDYVALDDPDATGWLEVRLDLAQLAAYVRVERPAVAFDEDALLYGS